MSSDRVACRSPVFSPDGRYLFVTSGCTIRCFSVATGAQLFVLAGHSRSVTGVCMHPLNGRQVLSSSLDGTLRAWDADDGACLRVYSVGAPVTHIASCALPPRSAALVFLAVLHSPPPAAAPSASSTPAAAITGGDEAKPRKSRVSFSAPVARDARCGGDCGPICVCTYPLGDEVACMRGRALGVAMASTVDSDGSRRSLPHVQLTAFDLHSGTTQTVIATKSGFVTGLDVQCRGVASSPTGVIPELVVACTVRDRLHVWRSDVRGERSRGMKVPDAATACALHPRDGYAVVGDSQGRVHTMISSELGVMDAEEEDGGKRRDRVTMTSAHWHAHSVWATAFTPDGSYLVSGGEEAVAVLWRLSPASSVASVSTIGPRKDKKSMAFLPRVGAPIRSIGVYAHAVGGGTAATDTSSSGGHTREVPALMIALGLVDNSVVVINSSALTEMWRFKGLSVGGMLALPPVGVLNALARMRSSSRVGTAALISAAEQVSHALRGGAGATFLPSGARVDLPSALRAPEKLGLGNRSTLLTATTRYLTRGCVVDPRSRMLVLNDLPGRAALQWYDVRKAAHVAELEVAPRNMVSRADAEPPPPIRVTHVTFSHDGSCMVTVDVSATLDVSADTTSLKFWTWHGGHEKFVLSTRVEAPHKTDVLCCEFHPTLRLVVTGSRDRTFKLWEETTYASLAPVNKEPVAPGKRSGSKKDASAAAATTTNGAAGGSEGKSAAAATGAVVNGGKASAHARDIPPVPTLVWQCRSVGFYRDLPVNAAAFSGDGTCLALAYGHMVTLWDWRDNTLHHTLCDMADTASAGGSIVPAQVTHVAFAGLSSLLISASATGVCVWDVLTCAQVWSYAANVISLAADRIGLSTSTRFAVVVSVPRAETAGNVHSANDDDDDDEDAVLERPPAADCMLVLFDAPSPLPLQIQRLDVTGAARDINSASLPPYIRAPTHALAFIPSAAASGGHTAARAAHDVLVLNAYNDVQRIVTPSAAPAPAPAKDAAVAPVAAPSRAAAPIVAAPRQIIQSTSLPAPAAAATAASRLHDTSVSTVLSSFGATHALPPTTLLFDSLMSALLAPAQSEPAQTGRATETAPEPRPRAQPSPTISATDPGSQALRSISTSEPWLAEMASWGLRVPSIAAPAALDVAMQDAASFSTRMDDYAAFFTSPAPPAAAVAALAPQPSAASAAPVAAAPAPAPAAIASAAKPRAGKRPRNEGTAPDATATPVAPPAAAPSLPTPVQTKDVESTVAAGIASRKKPRRAVGGASTAETVPDALPPTAPPAAAPAASARTASISTRTRRRTDSDAGASVASATASVRSTRSATRAAATAVAEVVKADEDAAATADTPVSPPVAATRTAAAAPTPSTTRRSTRTAAVSSSQQAATAPAPAAAPLTSGKKGKRGAAK